MKRLLPLFLSLFLLFSLPVQAEESSVSVRLATSMPQAQEVILPFDSAWFRGDAHEYRHDLCRLSLGLAIAAFRNQEGDPAADIRQFFDALSFRDADIRQFDETTEDSIGTAMAWRAIEAEEGAFPLVVIGVSGGNYGLEWASNFDMGDGDRHRGFLASAQVVRDRAEEYVAAHGWQRGDVRFWIAGYSRGAAVSNVAAALMAESGLATDDHLFAYTFATPATVTGAWVGQHENILNLVNIADLVPQVPPAEWGYGRYGRTLYLPSSRDENHDYAALLPAFRAAYQDLTGRESDQDDSAYAFMAQGAAHGLILTIQNMDRYEKIYQPLLTKVFTGQELNDAENLMAGTLLMNIANAALKTGEEKITLSLLQGPDALFAAAADSPVSVIFYQHMTEIYASWLLALPDGETLFHSSLTLTDTPVL